MATRDEVRAAQDAALLRAQMMIDEANCDARASELIEELRQRITAPEPTLQQKVTAARNLTAVQPLARRTR